MQSLVKWCARGRTSLWLDFSLCLLSLVSVARNSEPSHRALGAAALGAPVLRQIGDPLLDGLGFPWPIVGLALAIHNGLAAKASL